MSRTKNKHIEQQDLTGIKNKLLLCVLDFSIFIFYLHVFICILQEMFSCHLGMVNDFHWGFKPVFCYSRPHTFQHALEKEKCIYSLCPGHLEYKQNMKVKGSPSKKGGGV